MLIRQNQVFPEYRKEVSYLTEKYEYFKSIMVDGYVDELMKIRGYVSDSQRNLIRTMQLGYCTVSPLDYEEVFGLDYAKELGIITAQNNFLLDNRYIIPVEDIGGNLVSMIGYFNDTRKYITLPTNFFAKDCILFNFKQAYELSWKEYGGFVIIVEGIFDCLSLRAIGLPAVATMGATVGTVKCELLKYFKKVLAIPDDDKTGHKAFSTWKLPSTSTILKFNGGVVDIGGSKLKCKDMDNFVSWYDEDDVRELLLSFRDSKNAFEEVVL
jgi:DNA primase